MRFFLIIQRLYNKKNFEWQKLKKSYITNESENISCKCVSRSMNIILFIFK